MILFLLGYVALAVAGLAEVPAMLDTAIKKLQADEDHWAFTQTTLKFDRDGKSTEGSKIERYNPALPDSQQWTLLQWKGSEPTEREMSAWKKRKEKEIKRRGEKTLGEIMDFEHARKVEESASEVIFEIPLLPGASKRLPEDKFVVHMAVDPQRETLQAFSLKTVGSFRALGVAKIESIEIQASFRTIDEQYTPQPERILARGSGKLLFFRVAAGAEITWTDFKRVKPYKDRFEVKIGELKAFGF